MTGGISIKTMRKNGAGRDATKRAKQRMLRLAALKISKRALPMRASTGIEINSPSPRTNPDTALYRVLFMHY